MRIHTEDLRRHYESLSSEELLDLERDDLTEMARLVYDEELARRGLTAQKRALDAAGTDDGDAAPFEDMVAAPDCASDPDSDGSAPPEWLESAANACGFPVYTSADSAFEKAQACLVVLRAAGIPCHLVLNPLEPPNVETAPRQEYAVMVPGGLNLKASGVLDRDVFNEQREESLRTHLASLSDEDLRALDSEMLCAGLLDCAARLKRAYQQEVERRAAAHR